LARVPYRTLLTDRTFIGNTLAGFAVACGITVTLAWLPPFLTRGLGYSPTTTGWLTTMPWAASVILVLLGSAVSQRLLRRGVSSRSARGTMLCACLAAGGLATAAMTLSPPGAPQILLLAIGFGLPTLVWTLSPAIIAEVTPVTQRGAMLGIFNTIANSGAGSFAPYFMGLIIERSATPIGGYATGFMLLGCFQIGAGIIAWLLIRPEVTSAVFARKAQVSVPAEATALS
jgi:MFS family permease